MMFLRALLRMEIAQPQSNRGDEGDDTLFNSEARDQIGATAF